MDLWNWIVRSLQVDSWGVTPAALLAPLGLVTLIIMAQRLVRERGPDGEKRDIGGMVLLVAIIGGAFVWVFMGIGALQRSFH